MINPDHLVTIADPATFDQLRALRLWHWRTYQQLKTMSQASRVLVELGDREELAKKAIFHLTQVQLLNEFFPVGDTAEGDDK